MSISGICGRKSRKIQTTPGISRQYGGQDIFLRRTTVRIEVYKRETLGYEKMEKSIYNHEPLQEKREKELWTI